MPPKSLRSSVAGSTANNSGVSKMMSQLTDRVALLEKRCSKVMIHQTYFKILDEWLQCMFGAVLFPKTKDIEKFDDAVMDEDTDNPFYEVHMLNHRVKFIEDELQSSLGIDIPRLMPKKSTAASKAPPKRSYGPSVIRRRSIISPSKLPPPRPPILKPAATPVPTVAPTTAEKENSNKEETTTTLENTDVKENIDENATPTLPEEKVAEVVEKSSEEDEDKDKPPVLEEIKAEPDDDADMEQEQEPSTPDDYSKSGRSSVADKAEVKMEVDDEQMEDDEDFEDKVDIDDLEYAVGRYAEKKIRETAGKRKSANNGGNYAAEEEPPAVTYTTRGRRHTLPRRYAEFTGHDNVASILKSQQRASGSNTTKIKKAAVEKPKTPSKPKPPPKLVTPKKADGSRPDCVYKLIADVQSKQADEDGNVTLWDLIPSVKVNQQQLISVIFRSNGMATRLTRKLTTLVFEDQVLANTSPFGTKYYSERLPPEPLEAMVEFICNSEFDPDHTKKKIYMVVGQVCNEARAGRVRKLVPSGATPATTSVVSVEEITPSTSSTAPEPEPTE